MNRTRSLLAGFFAVALGEVAIHWVMTFRFARPILDMYLWTNLTGSSRAALVLDLVLPASLLGYLNGRLDRGSEPKKGELFAFPLCMGLVMLYPVYGGLMRKVAPAQWWPQHTLQVIFLYLMSLLFGSFIIMGVTESTRR